MYNSLACWNHKLINHNPKLPVAGLAQPALQTGKFKQTTVEVTPGWETIPAWHSPITPENVALQPA